MSNNQRFWEIILDLGYVYADDEGAAWEEANRILHQNGSVDFSLKERTGAEVDAERAALDLLDSLERVLNLLPSVCHEYDVVKEARARLAKAKGGDE